VAVAITIEEPALIFKDITPQEVAEITEGLEIHDIGTAIALGSEGLDEGVVPCLSPAPTDEEFNVLVTVDPGFGEDGSLGEQLSEALLL